MSPPRAASCSWPTASLRRCQPTTSRRRLSPNPRLSNSPSGGRAMKRLTLLLIACCVLVVIAGGVRAADPVTANELKQIGLAYHNYFATFNKGPEKPDDLLKYVENNQKLIDR